MSMIGPYAGVEADYRRSRITASFREHGKSRRPRLGRRHDETGTGAE